MSQKRARGSQSSQGNLTQSKIDESFFETPDTEKKKVNALVRFFVLNVGHKSHFKQSELVKVVGKKEPITFQQIIEKVKDIMLNVYGYNVLVWDDEETHSKGYIVSNALPHMNYNPDPNDPHDGDPNKILTLLILSHILMSKGTAAESSLYSFLKLLNITTECNHPIFGDVKGYIDNVLIKHKFLAIHSDPVLKKVNYSWGSRAESEISKHEVLKFVTKIYGGNVKSSAFVEQFKAAEKQGFDNTKLLVSRSRDLGLEKPLLQ